MIEVRQATDQDLELVRTLFLEYAESLGVDLEYQGFRAEIAALPGTYAPPAGCLLLATADATGAGCVAMRPLAENHCEMKRLCVRPGFRGLGLGQLLAEAAIEAARRRGYSEMRLDTLESMRTAHRLYAQLGFHEIEPYSAQYLPGTRFYALSLAP